MDVHGVIVTNTGICQRIPKRLGN